MSLRNLTSLEMLALSAAWLDPQRHRGALEASSLLVALVPALDSAHAAMSAVAQAPEPADAEQQLAVEREVARGLDRTHDRKGGGVHYVMVGAESLAESPEEEAVFADVRARLFPDGREVFSATYLAESGNAERITKELNDPAVCAVLDRIVVREGRSLLDETRAWLTAGHSLGVSETRKTALTAVIEAQAVESPSSRRSEAVTARVAWIQTVTAMLTNGKLLRGDEAVRFAAIMRELYECEAKADERVARRRAAKPPADPPPVA